MGKTDLLQQFGFGGWFVDSDAQWFLIGTISTGIAFQNRMLNFPTQGKSTSNQSLFDATNLERKRKNWSRPGNIVYWDSSPGLFNKQFLAWQGKLSRFFWVCWFSRWKPLQYVSILHSNASSWTPKTTTGHSDLWRLQPKTCGSPFGVEITLRAFLKIFLGWPNSSE